jgi:signal transduction histidine kinase
MLPLVWRRLLRAVRLGIGLICVGLQFAAAGWYGTGVLVTSVFAVFTIYAAIVLIWGKPEDAGHIGWALIIDSMVLFLAIASRAPYFEFVGILFYAFVLSEALFQHEWWRPVVIAALCIVDLNFTQPPNYAVLFPALAGAGILSSAVAVERFFLRERLANASRQSVMYRYDAEKARESERRRIAADFHDGPLQSFTSFQMRLEVIRKLMERADATAYDELVQLQDFCKSQVQELRAFVRSMRPVDMEGSLGASLRRVIEQFQKDSGIPASFVNPEFVDLAEPEVSVELLQIVREALYNVQKHSGATRVAVSVNKLDRVLEISIEDNGKGFPFSGKYTLEELELLRLGPGSIKSRVRTLGGELLLDSKPSHGACVRIRLAA